MYKIGDWVVRTIDGGPIGGVGDMAKILYASDVSVSVDRSRSYGINACTIWDMDRIRKATKLELLLNGIDTEQEMSYTDIKENDT
jgi:hypothetical protein